MESPLKSSVRYCIFSPFSSFATVSLCEVVGLAETFPSFPACGPFLPDVPGFQVPSDSVFLPQLRSFSRVLPLHLHFCNCSDVSVSSLLLTCPNQPSHDNRYRFHPCFLQDLPISPFLSPYCPWHDYNIQTWQTCFGRSCADGRFVVEYVSVVLVGRSGSVLLCTAGLEDMAVALSPGKCGSYRQILSNNSVSRWLRCRVNQTREIGPTRLSNIMQHQFDTGYVNNNMQNKQVW